MRLSSVVIIKTIWWLYLQAYKSRMDTLCEDFEMVEWDDQL